MKAQQQQRLTVLDEPARPHGRASLAPTTRTVAELQGLGSLLSAAELRAAVAIESDSWHIYVNIYAAGQLRMHWYAGQMHCALTPLEVQT